MIKVYKATKESRKRDKKRLRYILQVGRKKFHISAVELLDMYDYCEKIINEEPIRMIK